MIISFGNLIKIFNNRKVKSFLFILLLLLLSLLLVHFFLPGDRIYRGHDVRFHYMRLIALMKALDYHTPFTYLDYSAVKDFGYATKWFYPDIMLMPFAWIGKYTNIYFTYKVMIFTYTFLCGLFTYKTTQRIFGENMFVSVLTSLFYTFSFTYMYTMFYRSAISQGFASAFIPLAFLGIYEIMIGNSRRWYWLPIGLSLLIMTHLLSSVLFVLVLVLFLLFYYKKLDTNKIKLLILSAVATFLLSSVTLLPMIEFMLSDTFYYSIYPLAVAKDHTFSILEIVSGIFNGFSLSEDSQFGSLGILSVMFLFLRVFIKKNVNDMQFKLVDRLVLVGIFLIFMVSNFFPWGVYPFTVLNIIQFPHRLFQIVTYFFAIGSSYYIYILLKNLGIIRKYIFGFGLILAIIFMIVINANVYLWKVPYNTSITNDLTPPVKYGYNLGGLEYMPAAFGNYEKVETRKGWVASQNNTVVNNLILNNGRTSMDIKLDGSFDILELPRLYYKGYAGTLNGEKVKISESENGLIDVEVKQSGKLEIYYAGTALQKLSLAISICSLIIFLSYIFYFNKMLNRREKND